MIKTFNAVHYSENLRHTDIAECPAYVSRNADETVKLGRAFADTVRGMRGISRREKSPARIGIIAPSGTGKSTFIRGVIAELNDYHPIEVSTNLRLQQTFEHTNRIKGWLRHYDASLDDNNSLPSYLANDLSEFGMPFIDIVEHPIYDLYDTQFHCLIFMEKQNGAHSSAASRSFRFMTDTGFNHIEGFRTFSRKAEPFLAPQAAAPSPTKNF